MAKFKIGDRVRVIGEHFNQYEGEIDIIESITFRFITSPPQPAFYLKNCHLKFAGGERLYFIESELELVKEFYWMKKSIHGKF